MARYKSPFSNEVYDEWDQLVLDKGAKLSLQERQSRWRALYEKFFADGKWLVSADDASLIASLGTHLALETQDWHLANRLSQEFQAHGDLDQRRDRIHMMSSHVWLGITEILLGRVDHGVSRLLAPFSDKRFSNFEYRLTLRGPFSGMLTEAMDANDPLDRRLLPLAQELIASFPNCKRLSRLALSAKTNGELALLLDQTYPRVTESLGKNGSGPS